MINAKLRKNFTKNPYIRESRTNRMGIIDRIKEKLKKPDKKGKQITESK